MSQPVNPRPDVVSYGHYYCTACRRLLETIFPPDATRYEHLRLKCHDCQKVWIVTPNPVDTTLVPY